MRERPYINISGAAVNANKTAAFFDLNAPQYTSHYKSNRAHSILPVQAHFNSNKYRTKKPIPSNNTYVSIEGFLKNIDTDSNGHATKFHISVDNINFLGRATISPSGTGNTCILFLSRTLSVFDNFLSLLHPFDIVPLQIQLQHSFTRVIDRTISARNSIGHYSI